MFVHIPILFRNMYSISKRNTIIFFASIIFISLKFGIASSHISLDLKSQKMIICHAFINNISLVPNDR